VNLVGIAAPETAVDPCCESGNFCHEVCLVSFQ
jgi:hypothetical protein